MTVKLCPADVAAILEQYAAGVGAPSLGRQYGVTAAAIYYHLSTKQATIRAPGHNFYRGGPKTKERDCERCGCRFSYPDHSQYQGRRFCSDKCRAAWRGPTHCNAKHGPTVVNGYRRIRVPAEDVEKYARPGRERMFEHVYIACKTLGRRLRRGEVVHHINGDRLDNRRCNLLICTRGYHSYLHGEMARRWAHEHFGRR